VIECVLSFFSFLFSSFPTPLKSKTDDAYINPKFVRDSKGFIYFVDRIKDILKINGLQVSPTELEDLLLHHPKEYISDCAVAGVTPPPPLNSASREVHLRSREENSVAVDEKVPRAWVVLTENGRKVGRGAVKEELEGWVEQRAARHKWLNGGIEFVDEVSLLSFFSAFPC
jgi:acyl-CoA synthetase (AMP-forming)/AMP-acid ligase II